MWYIRENAVHEPITELLPKIFSSSKMSIGGWSENSYEYQDSKEFDSVSFNNYSGRKLDEIIEKIEDGADDDFNMKDYIDMTDRVSKKFEVGKWYNLPKKKDVRFSAIELFTKDYRYMKFDFESRNDECNNAHYRINLYAFPENEM
jgi:hypothetical protein